MVRQIKLECLCQLLKPSLILLVIVELTYSFGLGLALLTNIRKALENFTGTNTLTYFACH
jgi:hypothetical protein